MLQIYHTGIISFYAVCLVIDGTMVWKDGAHLHALRSVIHIENNVSSSSQQKQLFCILGNSER